MVVMKTSMVMVLMLNLVMMLMITNLSFMRDVIREIMVSPMYAISKYEMRETSVAKVSSNVEKCNQ